MNASKSYLTSWRFAWREKKLNFSCLENPCPQDSYPHASTWNETLDTPICHKPMNGLAGCELVVNEWEDEFLDCCTPGNRTECFIINQMVDYDDYDLELFSTSPTKTHSCTS